MGQKGLSYTSYEAYLALEAESDTKLEYHDGFIVAMPGGTPRHSQLGANAVTEANISLRSSEKNCTVYNSDLKIRIDSLNRTYYPDASIACEKQIFSEKDRNALTNPILLIEVLSAGNAHFDRGTKFHHYRHIPSLKEYVLISQQEAMVDVYFRREPEVWEMHTFRGVEETVVLKSLGIQLEMKDLYRGVSWE